MRDPADGSAWAEEHVISSRFIESLANAPFADVLKQTGIRVKVIAKGTGASLQLARDGNADVVLVHARAAVRVLEIITVQGHQPRPRAAISPTAAS